MRCIGALVVLVLVGCAGVPVAAPAPWQESGGGGEAATAPPTDAPPADTPPADTPPAAPTPGPGPAPVANPGHPLGPWRFLAEGHVGFARFEHRFSGRKDHAGAVLGRVEFEAARRYGGGLRFEFLRTDDELTFGDEALNYDLFGYFVWKLHRDRFYLPVRAGVMVNGLDRGDVGNDDFPLPGDVQTITVGPRIEVAPEWTLVKRARERFGLFVEGSAGYGVTYIDSELPTLEDEFRSEAFVGGVRAGLRYEIRKITIGASYMFRYTQVATSREEDFIFGPRRFPEQKYFLSGVVLSVGARW